MTTLVSSANETSGARLWLRRLVMALGMLGFVGLVAWAGLNLSHGPSRPARQVARIALLPDNPPPPPPPPEKPRVEPKDEIRQQIDRPKLETPPEPQQLKMEGEAGEGPSPFASGDVKNDYIGGDIGNGARFAAYVGRVADLIQDQLAKRNLKIANAKIYLWLKSDGAVQRFEIDAAKGDLERQLHLAMTDIARVPEAPPQDMPMPMGLQISGR
jgi:periplasmic protein TonB